LSLNISAYLFDEEMGKPLLKMAKAGATEFASVPKVLETLNLPMPKGRGFQITRLL